MFKRELLVPSILCILYVVSCVWAFSFMISRPGDKFSAMFIGILTMPWSFLIAFPLNLIEVIFNFEFVHVDKKIILLICAIINTVLVFFLARKVIIMWKSEREGR